MRKYALLFALALSLLFTFTLFAADPQPQKPRMGCDKKVVAPGKIRCGGEGSEGFTVVWRIFEAPPGEKPYVLSQVSGREVEMPVQGKKSWIYTCSYHKGAEDTEPKLRLAFWAWQEGDEALIAQYEPPAPQSRDGCLVSFPGGKILYEKLIIHEQLADSYLVSFPENPDKVGRRQVWVAKELVLFRDRPGKVGGRSCKCPPTFWENPVSAEFR